jgi:hypothetical protein
MEPQEGDIAEDGNGNFLVRRGNEWYPAQADGRPLERIPRFDYGAGHYQLPNGDIVRQGPRGGQETVENFGGAGGGAGGSGLVSADQRGRYNIGADPLVRAERNLAIEESRGNPFNRDWGAVALNAIDLDPRGDSSFRPFAPFANLVGGQDYQNAQQALSTYEASLMPIQSGASVTASEAARQIRADFPALGDSSETLKRKAANRRDRINAILSGIGRPPAFTDEDVANPTDTGTDQEVAALSQIGGNDLTATPSANSQMASDNPIDIAGLSASDLMELQPGQLIRFPDGRIERLSGSPRVGASGEEVSPGLFVERVSPEQSVEARREDTGIGRRADAFVRGAADAMTFGLADEITAGLNTVAPLDRGTRGGWNGDWAGAYQQNLDLMRAIDATDAEQMPITRGSGQFAGAVAAPGSMAAGRWVASAPRAINSATRGASVGAVGGGLYGAGSANGPIEARLQGAGQGAMVGAVGGGVLPPLARGVGYMTSAFTRPVTEGVSDAFSRFTGRPMTGEDRAVRTMMRGVNPAEATARLEEGRRFGANLTAADVGGSNVQGRVRVAATRQTPGRAVAEDFAAGRRSEVQDFAAGLGGRVSPMSATPGQLDEALEAYQRTASADAFGAVRGDRVTLNRDSVMALRSDEGRAAVRDAARLFASSTDVDERNIAAELNRLADVALDNPAGAEITVGAADLMARYLNRAGGADANRNRVFGSLGRTIRNDVRAQNPGYDAALTDYAARARLGGAVETGERFLGSGYTGDFVAAAGGMDEAQRGIASAAARAAIERASETGGSAPGLLDKLATGRGQQQRSAALLGPEGATDLQQGAQVGRRMVSAGANVNPRAGSPTFLNAQDEGAMQASGIAGNLFSGRPLQALGGVWDVIRSAGISDDQAEMIVRLATDPDRVDDVLQILRTRFPEQEARRIVSQLTPAIAAQSGGSSVPREQPRLMTSPRQ